MPFNYNMGQYVGGQLIAAGLSNLGQGLGGGLANALQGYHQEHMQQIQADALIQELQNTMNPSTGKPFLSSAAANEILAASGNQHAARVGGLLTALQLGRQPLPPQPPVPYTVGGRTYNIPPTEAAQLQTTQAEKVPTEVVPGKTISLTPGQSATAELEKQRIEIAKQPRGMTPYQQFQVTQAQQKALDEKVKASPEYKFTQDYKLPPRQVLTPDILDPSQQNYQLFDTTSGTPTELKPAYDQYGIARRPSWLKSDAPTYWTPTTDIFRESKIDRNVQGTKTTQYLPNPEGELVNIGGQRIPFSEIQGIKNRHDELLGQAQAALKAGKDPQVLAQWWDRLGYDPRELLQ
jgi:hypothetical protein